MSIKIVLATDGSTHAQYAIDMLRRLPVREADVTVVSVAHVEKPTLTDRHTWPVRDNIVSWFERTREEALMAASRQVEIAVEVLKRPEWQVDGTVQLGNPTEQILEVVRDTQADLLFVGSRGLGAAKGWLLGSVSQSLLSSVHCAVCVTRPKQNATCGKSIERARVLLATDGSRDAGAAMNMLETLGMNSDAELGVLNVVPCRLTSSLGFDLTPLSIASGEAIETGRTLVDTVSDHLRTFFPKVTPIVRTGDPAAEVIRLASEWNADLIAVGNRG